VPLSNIKLHLITRRVVKLPSVGKYWVFRLKPQLAWNSLAGNYSLMERPGHRRHAPCRRRLWNGPRMRCELI